MRMEEAQKVLEMRGKDASGPWPDRHLSEKQRWRPPALLSGAPQDTEMGSRQGVELSTAVLTQDVASQSGKFGLHPISSECCEFLALWKSVIPFHLVHLQL